MLKSTAYLDTSFLSAYWYRGKNEMLLNRRRVTRDWWVWERRHFRLWTSSVVEDELAEGVFPGQRESLKMCRQVVYCQVTREAKQFWRELLEARIVPENKPLDGWHLALAACHQLDYLVSWNFSHLANSDVQKRLDVLCSRRHWPSPQLVTPASIPQVRFGQVVLRRRP